MTPQWKNPYTATREKFNSVDSVKLTSSWRASRGCFSQKDSHTNLAAKLLFLGGRGACGVGNFGCGGIFNSHETRSSPYYS